MKFGWCMGLNALEGECKEGCLMELNQWDLFYYGMELIGKKGLDYLFGAIKKIKGKGMDVLVISAWSWNSSKIYDIHSKNLEQDEQIK